MRKKNVCVEALKFDLWPMLLKTAALILKIIIFKIHFIYLEDLDRLQNRAISTELVEKLKKNCPSFHCIDFENLKTVSKRLVVDYAN